MLLNAIVPAPTGMAEFVVLNCTKSPIKPKVPKSKSCVAPIYGT